MEQNTRPTTEKAHAGIDNKYKSYMPRTDPDDWKKNISKTTTHIWRSSASEEYGEESVKKQTETPAVPNEPAPAEVTKQEKEEKTSMEKKFDPMAYAEEWKKYVPKIGTRKEKKAAPAYDADSWKKYVKPAGTEKQTKTAPAYDADSWKKYVKPADPEKQTKTAPAYDADSWKKYVPSADIEKWKEYAEKAKTPGAGYTAKSGYLLTLPACNDFNLFNFAQISAPSGVKIRFKLPFPINGKGLKKLEELVKGANGTLETE